MNRRRHPLDDLDADIRDHIDRETDEYIARGLPPDEARAAARRAFGSAAMAAEDARAVWVPLWLDHLLQDAAYGARVLRRNPGFALVAIVTLAIGIGLNTVVFSVVNAVLVRPLAYANPDRLLWIATYDDRSPIELVAAPDVLAFRDRSTTLDRVAAFSIQMERWRRRARWLPRAWRRCRASSGTWRASRRRSGACRGPTKMPSC